MPIETMNQVIHAAVRRDLARLASALGAAPDGDRARAADLNRAWGQLYDQLRHHHEQEDTLLFPAFARAGIPSGLIETMESEHQVMVSALQDVDAALSSYAASGSAADAATAREQVTTASVVVERHLAHEEAELEPALLSHEDDPVVREAMKAVRKQPPGQIGWFVEWLRDGASAEALAALDATIPRPVQKVFGTVFGRGYRTTIAPVWR
jgi:DUF438 domain-containing protein